MTAQDYLNNGYRLSLHTPQAEITAKEELAYNSYVKPILPNADKEADEVKSTIMAIAFLLLLQASIFSTRSGAKIKTAPQSSNANEWQIINETVVTAHSNIENLKTNPEAVPNAKIYDVAHIYFRTQYFNI